MQTSNETNRRQLEVAREQGAAQRHAIEAMKKETGHAGQVKSGDYLIGYAVEAAEGLYRWREGRLMWEEPSDENAHMEVVVCDADDGRFIPGLDVTLTVRDANGRELGTHVQPLLCHPWLMHYGRNWTLPESGAYTLAVHVEPLRLARHDKRNGGRFAEAVDVEFRNVSVETGQKRS